MGTTDIYRTQAVTTAGPAQLVLMLFDRAIVAVRRVRDAEVAPERLGALEVMNAELQRAQDIVSELQATLDFDRGGDIAVNLDRLYTFCLGELISANIEKDASRLAPVEDVLADLRQAWDQACCGAPMPVAVGS